MRADGKWKNRSVSFTHSSQAAGAPAADDAGLAFEVALLTDSLAQLGLEVVRVDDGVVDASPGQLVGFAEPLVGRGAKALFLKGQDVEAELTEATKYWNIQPKLHSSRSGGQGWIVELDHIERRNPSATAQSDRA